MSRFKIKTFAFKIAVWCLGVLWLTGCGSSTVSADFIQAQIPVSFTTNGGSVTVQAYVADSEAERTQGLGKVESLSAGQGMLFIFPQTTPATFWMKDVEYPIDIIWIRDGEVIGLESAVPPELPATPLAEYKHYSPGQPITWVMELPAGEAEHLGITIGTSVIL